MTEIIRTNYDYWKGENDREDAELAEKKRKEDETLKEEEEEDVEAERQSVGDDIPAIDEE